jgi:hypothetical protein
VADSDDPPVVDDFDDPDVQPDPPSDKPDDGDKVDPALRKARDDAAKYRTRLRDLQAELDRVKKEGMPADERKLEDARQEGERRAAERHAARIVKAEVKALGAKKLEDPEDAVAFLGDLQGFVDDDGEVDAAALNKAIDKLIERKPYLAAKGAGRRRHGDGDGGDRGSADKPADMNTLIRSKARARA